MIKGIGAVTCVHVNPILDKFWIIDYRIYDPEGAAKLAERAREMLLNCVYQKQLAF